MAGGALGMLLLEYRYSGCLVRIGRSPSGDSEVAVAVVVVINCVQNPVSTQTAASSRALKAPMLGAYFKCSFLCLVPMGPVRSVCRSRRWYRREVGGCVVDVGVFGGDNKDMT